MRILRSFPNETPPPGRGYVQDSLERFPQPAFDYTGLKAYGEDLIVIEWDVAASALDLAMFAKRAQGRDWPLVAPFLSRDSARYMHWRVEGGSQRPIRKGEPDCDLFGFGLVYFPAWVIRDYPSGYQGSSILSDGTLPRWLREQPEWKPVPVDWSITVVHIS